MSTNISLFQFVAAVASASFATFLGSFAVEWLKDKRGAKRLRNEYKAQLEIELEQLVKMIIRLKSEYKARHYFPINIIELLAGTLLRTEERLKTLTLIANTDLQRQVFETVADCRVLTIGISGTENWPLEKGITDDEKTKRLNQAKQDRPEQNVELSDMQRRLEELVKSLKI